MNEKQPIREIVVTVSSDSFWNWLADETQIDLHDMNISSVVDLVDEDGVAITLMRKEPPYFNATEVLMEQMAKAGRGIRGRTDA